MSAEDVYRDNPYEYEFTVQKRSDATGTLVPATGLTDLHGWLATAPDGAALHADLDLLLAERASKPGTYFGKVAADAINARVFEGDPSYAGQTLYVVAKNPDIHVYAKVKARTTRPAS